MECVKAKSNSVHFIDSEPDNSCRHAEYNNAEQCSAYQLNVETVNDTNETTN